MHKIFVVIFLCFFLQIKQCNAQKNGLYDCRILETVLKDTNINKFFHVDYIVPSISINSIAKQFKCDSIDVNGKKHGILFDSSNNSKYLQVKIYYENDNITKLWLSDIGTGGWVYIDIKFAKNRYKIIKTEFGYTTD